MGPEELQTRDKILETALSLFLQNGYEKTPIQAIIDAVGIAKGTFYHHFASKEEMLVTLAQNLSRRVVDAVRPVIADTRLTAIEKLLAMSRSAVSRKTEDFGPEVMVLLRQMGLASNRRLSDSIEEISRQWVLPLYTQVIVQGVDEGLFRVRNPHIAAELIVGTILSMNRLCTDLLLAAVEGDPQAVGQLVEVYRSVEEAVERILGSAPGSLPIYTTLDVGALVARLVEGGKE